MRRKKKSVHLVFKSHNSGERFSLQKNIPRKLKTILVEGSDGTEADSLDAREIGHWDDSETYDRSRKEYLLKALGKGKKARFGEHLATPAEKWKMVQLQDDRNRLYSIADDNPSAKNIKFFFTAFAALNAFRHQLILRSIKEAQRQGAVEAQYGTAHSILARTLRKEGIPFTRKLQAQLFDFGPEIRRAIELGLDPEKISPVEYKRGFVSDYILTDPNFFDAIAGKSNEKMTEKDWKFSRLVVRTLLSRLREENLDEILQSRDWRLPFLLNGLPNPRKTRLKRKDFVAFLRKHSPAWRRIESHAKRVKELRLEEKRKQRLSPGKKNVS